MSGNTPVKPRILIVDDEPVNLKILSNLLHTDYDILIARTGEKCLEIAESENKPDLILLDINLPGMNGYEVCRKLKERDISRDTIIIFLTGRSDAEDEERGFRLGAGDYIIKPFRPIVVTARIRNQINLKMRTDELEKIALTDGLTGLANRRQYDEQLQKLWFHCMREKKPLSIIMADIDYFKLYNDHYGHGGGDDCLRIVGKIIQKAVSRSIDVAARYGGEEFAVILPNTAVENALIVAELIRTTIYDEQILHEKSHIPPYVTLSLGCASITPTQEQDPLALVKRADEALYNAKQQGRNQTCCL